MHFSGFLFQEIFRNVSQSFQAEHNLVICLNKCHTIFKCKNLTILCKMQIFPFRICQHQTPSLKHELNFVAVFKSRMMQINKCPCSRVFAHAEPGHSLFGDQRGNSNPPIFLFFYLGGQEKIDIPAETSTFYVSPIANKSKLAFHLLSFLPLPFSKASCL